MIRGITFADQLTTSDDFAHLQNKWFNGVSGVTKGCTVTADADNLYVGAGYFLICGRLVRIVGNETIASEVVEVQKYCKLVFEIDLSKTNSTTVFTQGSFKILSDTTGYPDIIQEDLDADGTVYQMEFARFIKTTTSITSFESRTVDLSVSDVWSKLENEFDTKKADFTTYFDEQTQTVETWIETTQTNINNEWSTYYNAKTNEIDNAVDGKIDELNAEIAKVQDGSLVTVGEFKPTVTYSTYKSNQDANGIYTTVTYKRADGTTYKVSQLSNVDNNGNYTTQTITYYAANGSTVDKTEVYTITYNSDGDVESEVLTNA
jgi:hypothetical protein